MATVYKPIVLNVSTFDAKKNYIDYDPSKGDDQEMGKRVRFTYSGTIIKSNTMKIYDAQSSELMYVSDHYGSSSYNVIPPNTLDNGKQYKVTIITHIDSNPANDSPESDAKYFNTCEGESAFYLDGLNVTTENIAENSKLPVTCRCEFEYKYNEDKEKYDYLRSVEFVLYDISMRKVATSGYVYKLYYDDDYEKKIYTQSATFIFNGLENNEIYYIKAIGTTKNNGLVTETPIYKIKAYYTNPNLYSLIYATPREKGTGIIKYKTNLHFYVPSRKVLSQEGDKYIYSTVEVDKYYMDKGLIANSIIDLTKDYDDPETGKKEKEYLSYMENIDISGNFVFGLKHKYTDGNFFTLSNANGNKIELELHPEHGGFRYILTLNNNFVIQQKKLNIVASTEYIKFLVVYIYRIDNVYGVYSSIIYDYLDRDFNVWLNESVQSLYDEDKKPIAKPLDVHTNTGSYEGCITDDDRVVTDNKPDVSTVDDSIIWLGNKEGGTK